MLRLKSFNFDQDQEMNALLDNYRLAQGAHVFVSDGKIIIPYEDGLPKTNAQRIIDIKEQKNIILDQVHIITHSQDVLENLKVDAERRVDEAEANFAEAKNKSGKDKYDEVKKCEEVLKQAKDALTNVLSQIEQNKVELVRLQLNTEIFDEEINELR